RMRPLSTEKARNEILRLMLRSLLAERFNLTVHADQRELPIFNLVVGKNGPKLQQAVPRDCAAPGVRCHNLSGGLRTGLEGHTVTMADLAKNLTPFSGRLVFDKTGIDGDFDIQIAPWTRAEQPSSPGVLSGLEPPPDPSNPDLFTVIQQLGLRL